MINVRVAGTPVENQDTETHKHEKRRRGGGSCRCCSVPTSKSEGRNRARHIGASKSFPLVDAELAPLVAALNKLPGIETVSSCQESYRKDLASVCHALRQIDRALTVAGLWSKVTLNFGRERLWCAIEVRAEDIMRAAHAIERLNLAGSKPSPSFWRF